MESLKDRTQELQDIMDEFAGAKKNASIFVKEAAEKGGYSYRLLLPICPYGDNQRGRNVQRAALRLQL